MLLKFLFSVYKFQITLASVNNFTDLKEQDLLLLFFSIVFVFQFVEFNTCLSLLSSIYFKFHLLFTFQFLRKATEIQQFISGLSVFSTQVQNTMHFILDTSLTISKIFGGIFIYFCPIQNISNFFFDFLFEPRVTQKYSQFLTIFSRYVSIDFKFNSISQRIYFVLIDLF